jgi:[acyl-carrier-protein] S-malonyltransferase
MLRNRPLNGSMHGPPTTRAQTPHPGGRSRHAPGIPAPGRKGVPVSNMNATSSRVAVLFPGQGSQTPEMRDLVAQRSPELLDRVVELVGEDPFARVDESTRFQQPAIFCASIAGWQGLAGDVQPGAAAGHSLGELAALAAAGVLSVDDALELVVLRGRLMAEADDRGSMIALVGADAA